MKEGTEEVVEFVQGAGGRAMGELIDAHILPGFTEKNAGTVGLDMLDDGGSIDIGGEKELILTTDSHVVQPLFFPGGDIGRLAVSGTVNDLAVMGAEPSALTCSLIIEEGFPMEKLDEILESMDRTLQEAGTPLITGDTKVLRSGELDGVLINTAGIGISERPIPDSGMVPGNKILVSGSIGDHGMALMQHREGLTFESRLRSDVAPVTGIVSRALSVGGVTAMKDPTRGGLAEALSEMAKKSDVGVSIEEDSIPVKESTRGIASLIGISPYQVANEGKVVMSVKEEKADELLRAVGEDSLGGEAALIGQVTNERPGKVIMETKVGGRRFLEPPEGDPVPRIC